MTPLTSGIANNQTVLTTASVSPSSDALVLFAIHARQGDGNPATPSVAGNGLTWVLERRFDYDTSGTEGTLFLFRALGSSPSSGQITADFGADTITDLSWSVVEFTDVDTSGSNGSGAIGQINQNPALSDQSITVIGVAMSSFAAGSVAYGVAAKDSTGAFTGDTNMTGIHNESAGSGRLHTQWKDGEELNIGWTFSAAVGVGFGLEIKASAIASTSLLATGTQTIEDVVDEADTTTDLHLSIDDDPASPNDADWINNAVEAGGGGGSGNFSPAASLDDSFSFSASWTNNTFLYAGKSGATRIDSVIRFPNVTIPQGATITSAVLTLQRVQDEFDTTAGSPSTLIRCVAEDDFVAPTNETEFEADPLTTASVEWDFASATSGTHDTPDLAAIVQEVIDRAGWVSGNALGISIKDDASANDNAQSWVSFDGGGTIELAVEYS